MIAAVVLATVAIAGLVYALRSALDLADKIDQRANAERHVLAGRLQRPDIFPTAPLGPAVPPPDVEEPPSAAWEQAGRDSSFLTPEAFEAAFGKVTPDA